MFIHHLLWCAIVQTPSGDGIHGNADVVEISNVTLVLSNLRLEDQGVINLSVTNGSSIEPTRKKTSIL